MEQEKPQLDSTENPWSTEKQENPNPWCLWLVDMQNEVRVAFTGANLRTALTNLRTSEKIEGYLQKKSHGYLQSNCILTDYAMSANGEDSRENNTW